MTVDRGENRCHGSCPLVGGSSFRDLEAYRHAVALGDAVHAEVLRWDSFERWSTGLQLVRSVDSVGANIAEAVGRWHEADKRRILFIARGSLYETEHWLTTAAKRELLEGSYSSQVNEIARALNGLIRRPIPR